METVSSRVMEEGELAKSHGRGRVIAIWNQGKQGRAGSVSLRASLPAL